MHPLDKKTLGSTGLAVTRLGLGCSSLGRLTGDTADEDAAQVVRQALSLGINLFDTAPLYGAGTSEERLGKALQGVDRDRYVLATKVGRLLEPTGGGRRQVVYDFSYDGVMRSFQDSLRRVGVDRIDVLHIHDADRHYDEAIVGAYPALAKLRSQGAIRGVSAGMNQWEMLARFAREEAFDCFLLAGRYSLLEQDSLDEFLPLCMEKGIGVMAGGTYNSGILAKGAESGTYNYREPPPEIGDKARALEAVAARHRVDLRAAASQFVLAHPAITSIIPSTRRPERVKENFELISVEIPADFWVELKAEGLIRAETPMPGGIGETA